MIYTLETAANKYGVDTVNIMEFVFLGLISIYRVGGEFSLDITYGELDNSIQKVEVFKLDDGFMHEIAEEYMSTYDSGISFLDQIMTSNDFRGIRFLGSEIDAVIDGKKSITVSKEAYKPPPIKREAKWNVCINEALEEFEKDNGYKATTTIEIYQRLLHKPPKSFIVTDHGIDGISIEDNSPTPCNSLKKTIKLRMGI